MIYFPTNWGAKEPQNPPNHRVDKLLIFILKLSDLCLVSDEQRIATDEVFFPYQMTDRKGSPTKGPGLVEHQPIIF